MEGSGLSVTEPRVLLIALGNPLRRDDGVAQQVLDLLPPRPGLASQAHLQLTPELAPGLAGFDLVVFIDADVRAEELRIELVGQRPARPALTHAVDPASVVALAAQLFGFHGSALVCGIPVEDFSPGEGLSMKAATAAAAAARQIEKLLVPSCPLPDGRGSVQAAASTEPRASASGQTSTPTSATWY